VEQKYRPFHSAHRLFHAITWHDEAHFAFIKLASFSIDLVMETGLEHFIVFVK
jgi:hypothetical protein